MNLGQLGFDYSNMVSCTIRRKSHLLALISFIFVASFLLILAPFLVLYIMKVPVDINGVPNAPGTPAYNEFMVTMLAIFGGLSTIFLFLGLVNLITKPHLFMIVDNNPEMDRFYYIYDRRRQQEIYLTEKFAIIYRKVYQATTKETNPSAIKEILDHYAFWRHLELTEDAVIKDKVNKTILKFKEKMSRYSTKVRRYVFSNDVNVVPVKVSESITVNTGGNTRSQAMYTYYFEDVNRKQIFEIHPEIKKTLSGI